MDDKYLRAIIADNHGAENAARAEREQFDSWTEADIARALDPENQEVRRLTAPPAADPEVERLTKIAAEVAPKN